MARKLYAEMIKPPDFDASRKYPVIDQCLRRSADPESAQRVGRTDLLWLEMMAEKGFLVFTLDNRGSFGRGHNFETPIYHQFGKVELADQLSGVKYLKSLPYVDGSRIGIWGWSYGGYMTLYGCSPLPMSSRRALPSRRSATGASTTRSTPSATWAARRKIPQATRIRRR